MHIRAYRDSDLPLLCQIFLRAVRETASRDYTPGQIAAWRRWMRRAGDKSWPTQSARWPWSTASRLALSPPSGRISICCSSRRIVPASGIGGALIEALCVQYPAQILTVDASITAKPCFTAHGFKVVAEQRVAARGEWFINYRMEKRVALR